MVQRLPCFRFGFRCWRHKSGGWILMIATCYPYTMSIEIPIPDFVRQISNFSFLGSAVKKNTKAYISLVVCNLPTQTGGGLLLEFPRGKTSLWYVIQLVDTIGPLKHGNPITGVDFSRFHNVPGGNGQTSVYGGSQCWGHPSTGSGVQWCPMVFN